MFHGRQTWCRFLHAARKIVNNETTEAAKTKVCIYLCLFNLY